MTTETTPYETLPAEEWEIEATNLGPLYAALAKAQGEMQDLTKDRTVEVKHKSGGKHSYAYATLPGVIAAARGALSSNGLAVFDRVEDGTLVCTLAHASGASIESRLSLPKTNDPQAFGSAMTYGRRYLRLGLLGLAAEDDDDGQAAKDAASQGAQRGQKPKTQQAKPPPDLAAPLKWLAEHGLSQEDAEKAIGKPLREAITDKLWPVFVTKVTKGETTADTIWGRTAREAER